MGGSLFCVDQNLLVGCCLQQDWGGARRVCGDSAGGIWAALRVGAGPPAPAHVWKVSGRVGAAAKLRLNSSGHGVTAGEETWSVRSFFLPTLLLVLTLYGPFLALSGSGAGSRSCVYVLQAGAQPLPRHCSASPAATQTNTGHEPPLDFCGVFFPFDHTISAWHCELGFVFLEGVVGSEPLIKAV